MKKALNQFLTIVVFSIVLISCKKEEIKMESNRLGKDSVLLNLQNNTPINQKVILFDTVNAFRSQNSLSNDTLYQWDFTGSLGSYNEVKVVATLSGGTATTYTYINQSGPISNVNDLVTGLNTLGIGTFYVLSGNIVAVNGGTDTYTYQSLDLLNAIQFNWEFNNNSSKTVNITGVSLSGIIDWGDNTNSILSNANNHTYANSGNYLVSIEYEGALVTLDISSNQLTLFNTPISFPITLKTLDLQLNQLASFNPSIALPVGLWNLLLANNQLSSFNPSIALPSTLRILNLQLNQLSSFNPSIALPVDLQDLDLSFNQLTSFNPSIALPVGLQSFTITQNNLSSTEINNTLVYLNNIGYSTLIANLLQTPPAPPSGAGITAKNDLISRGCSITTD